MVNDFNNEIPIVNIKDMIPIEYGRHVVRDMDAFPCITARYYKGILNNQEEAAVGVLIGVPRKEVLRFETDVSEA